MADANILVQMAKVGPPTQPIVFKAATSRSTGESTKLMEIFLKIAEKSAGQLGLWTSIGSEMFTSD
jgi:hypothetical protein